MTMARWEREHAWAVVLAAGDGSRLTPLTRALYGESLPKQFAALHGTRSLLQQTVARILPLVPAKRIVVVVSAHYHALARRQLGAFAGLDLVAQPRNLGTGPGLLLPLARIRARDPEAAVAVFPCDHYFRHPGRVLDGVRAVLHALRQGDFPAALLGVEAKRAETEYGWIETGARLRPGHPLARIERFVEKPSADLATCLHAKGALWNTLISVARLADLWALLRSRIPSQTAAFEVYARHATEDGAERLLDVLYEEMLPANLSQDVFAKATDLAVLPVFGAGFSDWGTPERVFESLEGTAAHADLMGRMTGTLARA